MPETATEVGKIAGPLPPLPGTGWARENVWAEDSSGGMWGDYAVGMGFTARYTYTMPCGTRRLAADIDQFVEPLPVGEAGDDPEYGVTERTEVREEVRTPLPGQRHAYPAEGEWTENRVLDSDYDAHALIYHTLADAEAAAQRFALTDYRGMLYASPRF